ncbi:hypothetical protein, partial [Phocaeicola sartorii]|uniref:hypothetical protein n=1 Tax=Phocaeicola sartorii TaxID=671267 RepID=UPI002583CF6D
PRAVQEMAQRCRYQEENHISYLKTYQIFFLAKIQALANFCSLTGNDLETSEILCFTSFCSNSKERFS